MKNNYSIAQRNAIVEKYLWCVNAVIRKNRALMQSANLEYDDVYQQLSVRLIQTIAEFDPAKGMLKQHIFAQLRYELLDCCTPYCRYGMTGLPCNFQGEFLPMEEEQENYLFYEELAA